MKDDLDVARIHSWLKVVGRNLAIDVLRGRPTHTLLSRAYHQEPDALRKTDDVDDAAEARWLAARLSGLPPRQRAVMERRADGMSAGETARSMRLPYKTVESLTSRARTELRGALASTLALVVAAALPCRRILRPWPQTAVTAAAATTVVLLAAGPPTVAPHERPAPGTAAHAAVVHDAETPPTVGQQQAPAAPLAQSLLAGPPPVAQDGVPAPAPVQVVRPLSAAGVGYTGVQQTRSPGEQTMVESLLQCLRDGIDISPTHLGCRDGSSASDR